MESAGSGQSTDTSDGRSDSDAEDAAADRMEQSGTEGSHRSDDEPRKPFDVPPAMADDRAPTKPEPRDRLAAIDEPNWDRVRLLAVLAVVGLAIGQVLSGLGSAFQLFAAGAVVVGAGLGAAALWLGIDAYRQQSEWDRAHLLAAVAERTRSSGLLESERTAELIAELETQQALTEELIDELPDQRESIDELLETLTSRNEIVHELLEEEIQSLRDLRDGL